MKICIRLIGGLGNQMFQYAAAAELAKNLNRELEVDVNNFAVYKVHPLRLDKLNIRSGVLPVNYNKLKHSILGFIINKIKTKTSFIILYKELNYHFNEKWFELQHNWLKSRKIIILNGYFQSEKYFKHIKKNLQEEFKPKYPLDEFNEKIAEKIKKSNSVMLHVRRADYVTNKNALKTHGTCSKEYYQSAKLIINTKIKNAKYFIFSDDFNWVRSNLDLNGDEELVDWNTDSPEVDLYLMNLCKHHIIANSTFSWWGAWLSKNINGIKIYPEPWFEDININSKDLIPENWLGVNKNI